MDQANSLTSLCGHSWGCVICYAWIVARLAGNWGNICSPEYLVTVSTCMNLYGNTSARFAFFSLFSVFSGNYFSTFKMSLSFRKGGEAMLWGGHCQPAPWLTQSIQSRKRDPQKALNRKPPKGPQKSHREAFWKQAAFSCILSCCTQILISDHLLAMCCVLPLCWFKTSPLTYKIQTEVNRSWKNIEEYSDAQGLPPTPNSITLLFLYCSWYNIKAHCWYITPLTYLNRSATHKIQKAQPQIQQGPRKAFKRLWITLNLALLLHLALNTGYQDY